MNKQKAIPIISIVMPVHNTGKYLNACLDSICNQSFPHWELIAVNNGSNDNSLDILRAYEDKDERISVFEMGNADLLGALRKGYAHTKGELIQRMDSDDIMPEGKLSSMYDAWSAKGQGTVVTGSTHYFSEEGEIGDGFLKYDKWLSNVARQNIYRDQLYKECVIPSSCWLVHRDDFIRVGAFDPDVFPEDYDLCFRFIKGGLTIVGLDQVLHYWRDREDRISRNWEEYADNRFFDLKLHYFMDLDRKENRPLILWGAGRNGKDLAKKLISKSVNFTWVCDNERKIGKEIYGCILQEINSIDALSHPQIIVAVSSPEDQKEIAKLMETRNLKEGVNYWFFS